MALAIIHDEIIVKPEDVKDSFAKRSPKSLTICYKCYNFKIKLILTKPKLIYAMIFKYYNNVFLFYLLIVLILLWKSLPPPYKKKKKL